ncbi:MAG: hydrogen gas-evolving membrane-bound hydrogenase subunit E [Halanaerobiales bacterium]
MRFRDFLSLFLVIILGFVIFQAFDTGSDGKLSITQFGEVNLNDRASINYINKNVNAETSQLNFKETENPESGSANYVTSIIANYRALDTLGEITVLFIAAAGLAFVLGENKKSNAFGSDAPFIIKTGVKILFPLLFLLGIYIIVHGHLTPGGGFQGGAIIATAILLKFLAYRDYNLNHTGLTILESLAGISFLIIGLVGLYTDRSFLTNFLANGTLGTLFSAGVIPIIYILIGIKVGAELSGIISNLINA